MAEVATLRSHLVEELADLLDAEHQLTKALPKLAKTATSRQLKAALQQHLKQTRGHITRLNQAMRELGEKPESITCEGMQGLLEEGDTVVGRTSAGALRDAVIITGAQKVEHYEMASYGTARTYAQVLGEPRVAQILQQTLKEEKAADLLLTRIAERSINEEAAEQWQSEAEENNEAEDGVLMRSAGWAGAAAGKAARRLASGARSVASAVGMANDRSAARASRRSARRRITSRPRRRAGTRKR
jgi:ferritin-like metal-binding protein YciE